MKKIISVILSVIMLVACMTAAIPVSAAESETAASPIEATPITGWSLIGDSSANREIVTPIGNFTTAQGVKFTSNTELSIEKTALAGSTNANARLFYSYEPYIDGKNKDLGFNNAYVLSQNFANSSIILYVKTESANALHFQTGQSNKYNYNYYVTPTLGKNSTYYVAELGSQNWISKTVETVGTNNKSEVRNGVIEFDSAFEGYIKIPWSSFSCDTDFTNRIGSLEFRVASVGGKYGSVTVAPVFEVTKDSTSTEINIPDEYKPKPIEAKPITGWSLVGSSSAKREIVASIGNFTTAQGVKFTSDTELSIEKTALAGSTNAFAWLLYKYGDQTDKDPYTLSDNFKNSSLLLYVKTESANALHIQTAQKHGSYDYYGEVTLKKESTYYVAELDSRNWIRKTVETVGSTQDISYNGIIEFDSAFEGYIKIPWSSFIMGGNDTNISNMVGSFQFRVAGVGGEYGSVTVAPVFEVTKDSTLTEINIPDEYKSAPLDVKSIEMGTVKSRMTNFSVDKKDNGYSLYIDPTVIGDAEKAWESGDEKWTYVENAHTGSDGNANLIMSPALPLAAKDVDGFLIYLKTDKANEFSLTVEYEKGTHWNKGWNPTISLKPGENVQVLAAGSDNWEKKTIKKGGVYNSGAEATLVYGKVCFDKAFEGYIKIPFTSFGNDSGWAPYTTITNGALDRIVLFQSAFKGIGGTKFGGVVTDIVGFYTSDSPFTTFNVSAPTYETGDVNNDCFVNGTDLKELRKHLLGIKAEVSAVYGNVNEDTDGNVDILDLIRLKKIIAGA